MRTLYRDSLKALSQQPFNNALAVAFHGVALAYARIGVKKCVFIYTLRFNLLSCYELTAADAMTVIDALAALTTRMMN
jgi:hypothetical protein